MTTFAGFKTAAVLWVSLVLASAATNALAGDAPYEIKASGIRDNAARITWTTDIPGTTQVEFGPKKSYGKKSAVDDLPRMNHFAVLKGLKRNTTYHYRVTTTDIFSREHTSGDYTFTTLKAPPPKGQVYYVSTKGDDGNDGLSLKAAWRHIGYTAGRVKAGDTVKIEAGTYEEGPAESEKSVEVKTGGKKVAYETRSAVNIKASGTDVSPITFEGFNGVPVLDGSKYTKDGTFGIKITGSYVHIRGLKIKGYSIGIRPRGTSHVCISNCEVGPTGSIGIKARNNTYLIIDKCDVHNNGWNSFMLEIDQQPGSQSHHYTITNCKVHDNSAHNLIDTTVHFGNKNSHHHFDVINNDLYKCTSNGFFNHWDKKPALKHFNWSCNKLHHNGTHAMRVDALEDSYIYNNTFSDNSPKRGDSEITGSCRNVTFYKNSGARYVDVRGDGLLFLRNKFPYIRTGGGLTTIRDNRSGKFSAMRTGKGKMIAEFTDGRVFSTKRTWSNGKFDITEPVYLPAASRFTMEAFGFGVTCRIETYPICAVPEKGAVKITDVTLSPLNFTAGAGDGNKVTFTADRLKPGRKYVVKSDGKVLAGAAANKSGIIRFTHSDWKKAQKFTIEPAK